MKESLYLEMAAQSARGFNLRCIDGALHGQSKCVGFCAYEHHAGFLTARQEREHRCRERGCHYHHLKPAVQRHRKDDAAALCADILAAARAATAELEGLRVLRAEAEPDGSWTVWYVAIAGYDVAPAEARIAEKTGCRICLKPLRCDFDRAAVLFMGQ